MRLHLKKLSHKLKRPRLSWRKIISWGLVGLAGLVLAGFFALFILSRNLPSVEQFEQRLIKQSTKIYDREGKVLLYEVSAGQKRTVIPFDEIPANLKIATIAVEDENFYNEAAFSWKGILRALYVNITNRRVLQGGSTITQQLARNAFLTLEQTYTRKIKELVLAIRLDKNYSKDEILYFYLNEIPYGPNFYGVEAASKAFFGKSTHELNLSESAILAALPRGPSYYSPWGTHTKELFARQQFILRKMLDLNKISRAQYDEAISYKITFQPQGTGIKAPHFVMAVQDYLTKKYGEELVRTGGLRVTTSLDWKLQEIAERVVKNGVQRNTDLYNGRNGALVAEDPQTGQILAMVGSQDYFNTENEGNFNVATQGLRQPGSALKPFVYLTAMSKGYVPESIVFDVATEFSTNDACPDVPNFSETDTRCFHPQNFDEKFRGPVSLRQALGQSLNIPAVKVLYLAGMTDTLSTLKNFGVSTLDNPRRYGLSLVLGGGEIRLIELLGAYSTLASEGYRRPQTMVLEIKDGAGKILESYKEQGEQVIDSLYAQMINNILTDLDTRAGLLSANLGLTIFPGHDVALKTGTTSDYRDAWAFGYTPSLAVGVWAGNNNNTPMGRRGSSILAAIPMWNAFLKEALDTRPIETFARPEYNLPDKPILRGDYAGAGEIHSILYFVNRNDPTGPAPSNPYSDSQFTKWETSVLNWAGAFMPSIGDGSLESGPPLIEIQSPQSGDRLTDTVNLQAKISSPSSLSLIRVYFNQNAIEEWSGSFPNEYFLNWPFNPPVSSIQNLLEIEVINQEGQSSRSGILLYR